MAEWFIEGLLGRLLDSQDPTARTFIDSATFPIVPNMNPDGSAFRSERYAPMLQAPISTVSGKPRA